MKRSLVLMLAVMACSNDSPSEPEGARQTKKELHELAKARVIRGMLARTDGYAYAVDISLLMIFAAQEGDREMYEPLRSPSICTWTIQSRVPFLKAIITLFCSSGSC